MTRSPWLQALVASLVMTLYLGSAVPPARGQGDGGDIYQNLLKSTVWVVLPKGTQVDGGAVSIEYSYGTGAVVDVHKRLILTNHHVVRGKKDVLVYFPIYKKPGEVITERTAYLRGGAGLPGKVVYEERLKDLAVVQLTVPLPKGARELKLAKDRLKPGQSFHLIGNAGATGTLFAYNSGSVRQVDNIRFKATNRDGGDPVEVNAMCVVNNASVNSGDSGGPVVNSKGELVAVVQGRKPDDNLVSIFIDVSEVPAVLNKAKGIAPSTPPVVAKEPKQEDKPDKTDPKPAEGSVSKDEQEAASKLRKAKFWANSGDIKTAREKYEEIIKQHPMTKTADEARKLLEELKKK